MTALLVVVRVDADDANPDHTLNIRIPFAVDVSAAELGLVVGDAVAYAVAGRAAKSIDEARISDVWPEAVPS